MQEISEQESIFTYEDINFQVRQNYQIHWE